MAGAGGKGGQGGTGGNAATCAQIATDYAAAYTRAVMCNSGQSGQCTHLVKSSLTCNCQGWVNDTSELDPLQAMWTNAGCTSQLCPVACPSPGDLGACVPINSGDFCQGTTLTL
jgi:hypothetical protein